MRVKSLFPALRIAVVLTVVLLMSFDMALACKLFVMKRTCHSTVPCIPPSSCASNDCCRKPVAIFQNLGREWDYSDHKMIIVPAHGSTCASADNSHTSDEPSSEISKEVLEGTTSVVSDAPDTIEPTFPQDSSAGEDSTDVTVTEPAVEEDADQIDDGDTTADPDVDEEQASLPEDSPASEDSADAAEEDVDLFEDAAEADDAAVDEELESLFEDEVEAEDSADAAEEDVDLFEDAAEEDVDFFEDAAEADDAAVDEELESLFEDEVEAEDSADAAEETADLVEDAAEADDATVDEELESLFEDEVEVEGGAADGAKLFNQTFPLIETDNLLMRRWVDDTGGYFTIGHLVEVHADFIRLLKKNDRYCTVSWNRLSKLDQVYVSRVAVLVNDI